MGTLWQALEALPDRRTRKGRRYWLASIVLRSLSAKLAGANDLLAIQRWGGQLTPKALEALGITRGRVPAHATLDDIFRSLPAADLERALRGLVQTGNGLGHVAIDGKRLRSSEHGTSPGAHLLAAFSTWLQAHVGSLVVPPESAEVVEAIRLIRDLPLGPGDVVTGDAAFTYRPIVKAIRAKGADYFLVVTANQPELQAELADAFGDDFPLAAGLPPRPA